MTDDKLNNKERKFFGIHFLKPEPGHTPLTAIISHAYRVRNTEPFTTNIYMYFKRTGILLILDWTDRQVQVSVR